MAAIDLANDWLSFIGLSEFLSTVDRYKMHDGENEAGLVYTTLKTGFQMQIVYISTFVLFAMRHWLKHGPAT